MSDLRDLASRAATLSDATLFEELRSAVAHARAALEQIDGLTDADAVRAALAMLAPADEPPSAPKKSKPSKTHKADPAGGAV